MAIDVTDSGTASADYVLSGLRVIEVGAEDIEYCGLLLAGLGAEVIKVEPPGGSESRKIGPFLDDRSDINSSLFFWQYNRGKRSVVVDLTTTAGQEQFAGLLAGADILLQSAGPDCLLDSVGFDVTSLRNQYPWLIDARLSPFGETGPWARYRGSDLVHLALGGVTMNCGYDPEPDGHYDLPPQAPQMWHAYHIAGEQLAIGIVGALLFRQRSGHGQVVSCATHQTVAVNTETDLMSWVMRHVQLRRQTGQHARERIAPFPTIVPTKDGRWLMHPGFTSARRAPEAIRIMQFLEQFNTFHGLDSGDGAQAGSQANEPVHGREITGTGVLERSAERDAALRQQAVESFARRFTLANLPWKDGQEAGITWTPVRKPHENVSDDHWAVRGTFTEVDHPEHHRSFTYVTSKWQSTVSGWKAGRRAPLLDEDRESVLATAAPSSAQPLSVAEPLPEPMSVLGRPFPLRGVRILDFSWFLATAGGTRFLAAFGAESIKVEWKGRPDTRLGVMAPVGGREARAKATGPLKAVSDPDMGGQFNNKNPGKRGISLNLSHPKGLEIAKALLAHCDVVAEGFSPGTLDKLGLGYDVMRGIRPEIIYVQQSGMGALGTYGRFRSSGPTAQSLSGLTDMAGLPEPAPPSGWGYSYLDWMGAYSFALAILTGLLHRERTGKGQRIDASQVEEGIFLNGTAILDWSAHRREWRRFGNRSPFKQAAPHGIYRCAGEDRWVAIACFSDQDWQALATIADETGRWRNDSRFVTLAGRLAHQDVLDKLVEGWTSHQDAYHVMHTLQAARVAAGVCQTAEDRCESDEQLAALDWLTELEATKLGRWPVADIPVKLSESMPYVGGPIDHGAPCYGEHNYEVYGELLGLSSDEVDKLSSEGAI